MKLNIWKRILMFFHWLVATLAGAALTAFLIRPALAQDVRNWASAHLSATQSAVAGFALLAVFVALTVMQLCLIVRRGKGGDRGYIEVDSSETGRVRIAVSAVEQMVRQSVTAIDGIEDMQISIASDQEAIRINIVASIVSGSHVPTITMNMQRAIRQFVERNCGVAVRSVSISIDAVAGGEERRSRWGWNRRTPVAAAPNPEALETSRPVFEEETGVRETEPMQPAPEEPAAEQASADETPVEPEPPTFAEPRPIRLTLEHTPEPEEETADPDEAGKPEEKQFQ